MGHYDIFSALHISNALWMAVCIMLYSLYFDKCESEKAKKAGAFILAFSIIGMQVYRVSMGAVMGYFEWLDLLPLHVCNMMVIVMPVMFFTGK